MRVETEGLEEFKRKERKTVASAFIFFSVGIFLSFLWYVLVSILAAQIDSGPSGTEELTEVFVTLSYIIGAAGFSFVGMAFILVIYWAHLRNKRKRKKSRKILMPKARH
ncbi:MAG: hypothetical protein ACE5QW_04535 [Thermoplasmata archaeon]